MTPRDAFGPQRGRRQRRRRGRARPLPAEGAARGAAAGGPGRETTPAACERSGSLLALVLLAGGAIGAAKLVRRRLRYLTRDPRRLATAARRELADFLVDQGLDVDPSATPAELHQLVRHELGADAGRFAAALAAARFGPPQSSAAAATAHQARAARPAPRDPQRGRPAGAPARSRQAPVAESVIPAVVMAAGLGTRLRPLTERYAKAVLPIDGRPVVARLLRELAAAGCPRVTVVVGHLGEQVQRLLGDGGAFGVAVRYARQPQADGSADAVRRAGEEPPYLVLAADTVFPAGAIASLAHRPPSAGAIAVRRRPRRLRGARSRRPDRARSRSGRARRRSPARRSGPSARPCTSASAWTTARGSSGTRFRLPSTRESRLRRSRSARRAI